MNCPKCNEVAMIVYETPSKVELDICPNCRGIWLDEGEMLNFITDANQQMAALNKGIGAGTQTSLSCTKCDGGPLVKGNLAGFKELELEFCPDCRGFFLDEGEMGRLEAKKK